MSELDDIKERAAERRDIRVGPDSDVGVIVGRIIAPAEADLDRAIAIAGEQNKHLDAWEQWFHRIVDKFLAAGEQRKEARAAVLALRDALTEAKAIGKDMRDGGFTLMFVLAQKALTKTEHYEAFRQA